MPCYVSTKRRDRLEDLMGRYHSSHLTSDPTLTTTTSALPQAGAAAAVVPAAPVAASAGTVTTDNQDIDLGPQLGSIDDEMDDDDRAFIDDSEPVSYNCRIL